MNKEIVNSIKQMFAISRQLSSLTGRPFTPDGHMVGSIGEVYSQQFYGVELYQPGHALHDGKWNGHEVQIKATQGGKVYLKEEYDLLLVLKIYPDGYYEEIYNGEGKLPWQVLRDSGRVESQNGISIQINQLKKLKSRNKIPCLHSEMKKN